MSGHVKLVAVLTAKPGKAEALQALLSGMMDACRAEPGNLRWDIWRDQADANRFVLDELYVDQAAVGAHRDTSHFKHYFANIFDLADRTVYALDPVRES